MEGLKAGFFYGLVGLVYFSVFYLSALYMGPHMARTVWIDQTALLLLILGYCLFFPMCILSFSLYTLWPSFGMSLFFCLFPLSGAFLGAALGFPLDLFGKKEADGDAERRESGVFMYIPWGRNRQIAVKEKTINNFIIAGIILWILLCVLFSVLFADVPRN